MTSESRAEFPKSNFTPEKIKGNYPGKDIVSIDQFDRKSINELFQATDEVRPFAKDGLPLNILAGKQIVLLFYEPSSRTRASFQAATNQLGGDPIVVENPQAFSSVSKGETFDDTIRVFEGYSDAIVLRHPQVGAALRAAEVAKHVPIINAGDGIGEHPTQALLDMYTIWENKNKLDYIRGLMAGDLLNGRTIHSLIKGLSFFERNELYLLAPDKLKLSQEDLDSFKNRGVTLHEIRSLNEAPKDLDFWYWTRVQKERFDNVEEYEEVNNKFVVTQEVLNKYAGENTILMHPLPRVGEIDPEVDQDKRSVYLTKQIRNGMYVRMALLASVVDSKKK